MPDDDDDAQLQNPDQYYINKTERYYLNKRMDSIEETLEKGFREIQETIKYNNDKTMSAFKECQKNCKEEIVDIKTTVTSLSGYKNRAIGAVGVVVAILTLWKVG